MGTALENARLFDETQRLFKAEQQRTAELAIINSVQEGLVAKMDMQGIYDLVGDKIREIFDAQVLLIAIFDHTQGVSHAPYVVEKGERLPIKSGPFTALERYIIQTRQMIVWGENVAERAEELIGGLNVPVGEVPKSLVVMPLIVGDQVKGIISLQNVDRENAFSDSDVRLLTTLANSMSVALENARLFDETQRLVKETEQRNAELAIINSVQDGLAKKLDFRGIVDLVGEKIGEIFEADTVDVGMYDPERDWTSTLYYVDRGQRTPLPDSPAPRPSLIAIMVDTHKPLLTRTNDEGVRLGALPMPSGNAEKDKNESYLGVPIMTEGKVIGWIAVQSYEKNAYSQDDLRLLQTLANSMSVALENTPPL